MSLQLFFIRCTHVTNSSSIIKDIQDMCLTGLAILAIFYFHFGDTTKQDARNLLSSVLIQLCSQSDTFSEVLSSIYSSHGNGSREPSIDILLECLKSILALEGQAPLYIVLDALDECPDSSGLPTQRQEVLEILKELIDLKLPHLHFCVTSRPEVDIRIAFDPLNPYNVSLHNQKGQIKDLAEYIKSVVCSDAKIQNWPAKMKELVIDTLAKKGGGMYVIEVLTPSIPFSCDDFRFRWAYCQLETLRQCSLGDISKTLEELPENLDETYERILRGIPKKMQKYAHRIFQWIMVSSRPLGAEELAEVFAINFDEEMSGIPKFEPSWREPNAETAVLSACSALVAIVDGGWRGEIVQFSHFSVKEYLASDRIVDEGHVSNFHIHPKPAHTLLAKTCLSVLFQLDYSMDKAEIQTFRLAEYAAKYWVEHARFGDVSSYIRDGMDLLFDKGKPHFAIWVWVYNMDEYCMGYFSTDRPEQPDAVPLYYAALCGFRGLVERLLTAHLDDLNAGGGNWGSPLNAALGKGHLDIALFLLDRGADGKNVGEVDQTGLYIASSRGYADVVQSLIKHGADLDAICEDYDEDGCEVRWTPLHVAIYKEHRDIAVLLLERGADTEPRNSRDETALYMASYRGCADIVRQLISYGADLNAECEGIDEYCNNVKWTPLHVAISWGTPSISRTLLEHRANPNTPDDLGPTPLHLALHNIETTNVELLLEYRAKVDVQDKDGRTPLHTAAYHLNLKVVVVLLNHGADPGAKTKDGETPVQLADTPWWDASKEDQAPIIRLLSECKRERMWGL